MVLLNNMKSLMKYCKLCSMRGIGQYHTLSRLFQPLNVKPKDATVTKDQAISISQKLLMDTGVISLRSNGMFALLPLGQRVMTKLIKLMDTEMSCIGAQRLSLPLLTSGNLWKKTGRWESTGQELLTLLDRHGKEYVLSPTHEEAVTNLMSEMYPFSFRQLPLRLYQIGSKFRDEMKPRFGLIRSREFVMKDLYTFDGSEEAARDTYEEIGGAYNRIFQRLGIPYLREPSSSGEESEVPSPRKMVYDVYRKASAPMRRLHLQGDDEDDVNEPQTSSVSTWLASPVTMQRKSLPGKPPLNKGTRVGHTFLLGTKYSKTLNALYQNESGKPEVLQMGCYGIGLSRVLAASVEVLARAGNVKWPWEIVPFKICLIGPKKGSKEGGAASWVGHLAEVLSSTSALQDEVVVDDRDRLTIGKRVMEAKKSGYPFIVVVGKRACEMVPMFEVLDCVNDESQFLSHKMLMSWASQLS
ncbi:putative proline--tRNA ligase, mitochondrial [Chionoecetes opilio]|uniref:proline--tRNA ligase n=1 Tax=Chionoecetes opilio TaxID=41210 RepID=A0A8J4YB79_CHIOP|nr:putative proline--tRNA ligase, mitochondrial [Chionoecetes opilio]